MSSWKSVNQELPIYEENGEWHPTYNYVLVSDGDRKFSIARYSYKNINKTFIPCWEFLSTYSSGEGIAAYAGDIESEMLINEINYWMEFPEINVKSK